MAESTNALPCVVTLRLQDMRPNNVNRYLEAIFGEHGDRLGSGVMVTVTESRIRIRRLTE